MERKLTLLAVMVGLVGVVWVWGQQGGGREGGAEKTTGGIRFDSRIKAEEPEIDRNNPDWLAEYCLSRVKEVSELPIRYERQRGPMLVLEPVYKSERYEGFSGVETCDLDYYIWPKAEEAFADMGIEHAYSSSVWQEFHRAAAASVSAQLRTDNWRVIEDTGAEAVARPELMLVRDNPNLGLREYLDLFFTKDEEMVFELLIINTKDKR